MADYGKTCGAVLLCNWDGIFSERWRWRAIVNKTGSTQRIAVPPVEDRATVTGNMHKNMAKVGHVVLEICMRTWQTHGHDHHITPLPCLRQSNNSENRFNRKKTNWKVKGKIYFSFTANNGNKFTCLCHAHWTAMPEAPVASEFFSVDPRCYISQQFLNLELSRMRPQK